MIRDARLDEIRALHEQLIECEDVDCARMRGNVIRYDAMVRDWRREKKLTLEEAERIIQRPYLRATHQKLGSLMGTLAEATRTFSDGRRTHVARD